MALVNICLCVLIGAALGARFKFPILVPAALLATLVAATFELARGQQSWTVVATMMTSAIAVQTGYLLGVIAHAGIAAASLRGRGAVTTQKVGAA
jgi:hypothetical protein